jgi:hypothetical protein
MSNGIVAQAARVISVIGTLALCGCTSSPTWTASHAFSSGDQIVPMFADGLPSPADAEVQAPQTP